MENYIIRSREFEQMEKEFFCPPAEAPQWYEYWRKFRMDWFGSLGLRAENLRLRDHAADELAHYSAACADVEYNFPFGWKELEGIANRTDFDLKRHSEATGKDLAWFDDVTRERYLPFVIEPALGVDRACLAFLCDAAQEDEIDGEVRTVLRFHPAIAPVKAGIFPLVKKEGLPEIGHAIEAELRREFNVFYDEKGAIGRRYRRQDECGTPFCITVDFQSKDDQTVTVRHRDDCHQERMPIAALREYLRAKTSV